MTDPVDGMTVTVKGRPISQTDRGQQALRDAEQRRARRLGGFGKRGENFYTAARCSVAEDAQRGLWHAAGWADRSVQRDLAGLAERSGGRIIR